jgi:hypothetical protein
MEPSRLSKIAHSIPDPFGTFHNLSVLYDPFPICTEPFQKLPRSFRRLPRFWASRKRPSETLSDIFFYIHVQLTLINGVKPLSLWLYGYGTRGHVRNTFRENDRCLERLITASIPRSNTEIFIMTTFYINYNTKSYYYSIPYIVGGETIVLSSLSNMYSFTHIVSSMFLWHNNLVTC